MAEAGPRAQGAPPPALAMEARRPDWPAEAVQGAVAEADPVPHVRRLWPGRAHVQKHRPPSARRRANEPRLHPTAATTPRRHVRPRQRALSPGQEPARMAPARSECSAPWPMGSSPFACTRAPTSTRQSRHRGQQRGSGKRTATAPSRVAAAARDPRRSCRASGKATGRPRAQGRPGEVLAARQPAVDYACAPLHRQGEASRRCQPKPRQKSGSTRCTA